MSTTNSALLIVDAGHTRIKAALRDDEGWQWVRAEPASDPGSFLRWLEGWMREDEVRHAVLCSVLPALQQGSIPFSLASRVTLIGPGSIDPTRLAYDSPETLGPDRYMSALGASIRSDRAVVVIDAGSACTVDAMTSPDRFIGGAILPGLTLARRSLEPLFPGRAESEPILPEQFPGKTTDESSLGGTLGGWLGSVEQMLLRYRALLGSFDLYVTGGDGPWLMDHLSESWAETAVLDPWLLFEGVEAYRVMDADRRR